MTVHDRINRAASCCPKTSQDRDVLHAEDPILKAGSVTYILISVFQGPRHRWILNTVVRSIEATELKLPTLMPIMMQFIRSSRVRGGYDTRADRLMWLIPYQGVGKVAV
jgi:hypothetical protein